MKKSNSILVLLLAVLFISCDKKNESFPLDKKYWDLEDYKEAVLELRFGIKEDEKLPSFSDPETKPIVDKLTDQQNFEVILDDQALGLKHKNEMAQQFFDVWKDMTTIYNITDRTDKYVYEQEMLAVHKFGLGLQLRYFKLGNDEIAASADNPDDLQVKENLDSNISTQIRNFSLYLDYINEENAFSTDGLNSLADGIDTFFPKLIESHPNSDYSGLAEKITLLLKKTKSERIKTSLENLQKLIDSKKKTPEVVEVQ